MRKHHHPHGIFAGLLLASAVGAYAVPVTIQVDMGYRISQGQFNTDGSDHIEVQSSFNRTSGWGGNQLTNVPTSTIYQNTFDITNPAPNTVVEYKFHIWGTRDVWESLSWYPNGNRRFTLANAAQSLPSAYFGDDSGQAQSIEVTFQVDMSPQIGVGNFNPGAGDIIQAMGPFNRTWSGVALVEDASRPGVYTNSYVETMRAPGTRMEYKYAINVGGGGTLSYESISGYPDNNRSFMLTNVSPQVLPKDYFGDASGLPIKAGIYFQLDMSSQILVQAFDPVNDLVSVRGDVVGWDNPPGSGLQLFADASRPGIYTNTWLKDNQLTGAAFTYKYSYFKNGNTTWEGGANKSVTFTGTEPVNGAGYHMITLGPVLFDNWLANTNDYLSADTYVTFCVSMTNAQSYSSSILFDKSMQLAVNGNWIPWWNWTAAPADDYVMTNSTISSDWLFYTKPVLIPKNKPLQLTYKYGFYDNINSSMDNEWGYGTNHVRYIRSLGNYVLPLDTWAVPGTEPAIGALNVGAPSGGTIPVSWLGLPTAYLQTSSNLVNWVSHPETVNYGSPSGIYSTNYPTSGGPIFFRVIKPGT